MANREKQVDEVYQYDPQTALTMVGSQLRGLSSEEVLHRQEVYGPNQLDKPAGEPLWLTFLKNFSSLMAILLWIGGFVAFFFTDTPELGIAIWAVNVINGCFSFIQEYRAGKATKALEGMLPLYARVIRDGREEKILAEQLVPGDIVLIEEGDQISADGRILETANFQVNQSALTGESNPVNKNERAIEAAAEQPDLLAMKNMVFAGTSVSKGNAKILVTKIGMSTEFGQIAHLTQDVTQTVSPLQVELNRATKQISIIAISIGLFFLLAAVVFIHEPISKSFVFSLGMIVAFIPEGLLPTVTLSLAMAVQKMAKKNALVKKLASVETLGETTVICSDKTGTLTKNEMTVNHIWMPHQEFVVTGTGYEPVGQILADGRVTDSQNDESLTWLLKGAVLCNNASIQPPHGEQTRYTVLGDPTEACLKVLAQKAGLYLDTIHVEAPRVKELTFDSDRKRMTTIHELKSDFLGGHMVSFTKGAPKEIVDLSSQIYDQGQLKPMTKEMAEQILAANDAYAQDGLRVLALAARDLSNLTGDYSIQSVETDLIFMGLLVMQDPPRDDMEAAVAKCHQAHIRIIMITGDYGLTALSIARKIGIVQGDNPRLVTGQELSQLSDEQLQAILQEEVVFARIAPEQKYHIVSNLQKLGHIVAVTGDGVNDAPALKKADIGIAMGIAGTDVAKSSADMILTDDNFASIVHAIEEGRAVYQNIKKFLTYIFNSNTSEAVPSAFFLFSRGIIPLPLTVMQILSIDLGTDMMPALGLGIENTNPDIMQQAPRKRTDKLIDRPLLIKSFIWYGLMESTIAMAAFFYVGFLNGTGFTITPDIYHQAMTMTLGAIIFCQIGMVHNCRTERSSVLNKHFLDNVYINFGIVFEIILFLCLVYVPFFHPLFQTAPLGWQHWIFLILCPIPVLLIEEGRKYWLRQHNKA